MKKIIGLLTTFVLLLSLTVTVFATDYNVDWTVEYNGSELTSTFDKAKVDNALSQLMPGDSAILTVTLKNSGSKKTDFWMSNEVLKNFDGDEDEAGGAYTYKLTYNGTVLYDDDTVGGENPNADGTAGLMEATEALKDFFYLRSTIREASEVEYMDLKGYQESKKWESCLPVLQELRETVEKKEAEEQIQEESSDLASLLAKWQANTGSVQTSKKNGKKKK